MRIGIISGASSGIGRAIAFELDKRNLDELWLIGRNTEKLSVLSAELKTKTQKLVLDLTAKEAFNSISAQLSDGQYEVEYLVPCAGVGYTGSFENSTQSRIASTIDLNCRALSLLISCTLPYIINNGRIINIASGAGFLPQADFAVYAASKAYVISLSRAIGKELSHRNITVTAVCPGPVDTDFFKNLENVKEYKKKYLISAERVAKGAIKASDKGKAIYTPTVSMKLLHLGAKILPTSLLLKLTK